jgi:hypothetical protein
LKKSNDSLNCLLFPKQQCIMYVFRRIFFVPTNNTNYSLSTKCMYFEALQHPTVLKKKQRNKILRNHRTTKVCDLCMLVKVVAKRSQKLDWFSFLCSIELDWAVTQFPSLLTIVWYFHSQFECEVQIDAKNTQAIDGLFCSSKWINNSDLILDRHFII